MKTEGVVKEVLDERLRQINEEGYTAECDDRNDHAELAQAAACYLCYYGENMSCKQKGGKCPVDYAYFAEIWPAQWLSAMFKPDGGRRDLIKAAALIVAEIERLDRLSEGK